MLSKIHSTKLALNSNQLHEHLLQILQNLLYKDEDYSVIREMWYFSNTDNREGYTCVNLFVSSIIEEDGLEGKQWILKTHEMIRFSTNCLFKLSSWAKVSLLKL